MSRAFVDRFLLPGLAFKATVIGGGYATGRELVEFFMPAGPIGGLAGMALAMLLWSGICAATFLFAFRIGATDYHRFFRALLGRFDFAFELIYLAFLVLVLSVFGSAAGAIGTALFGWPEIGGTLALTGAVLVTCAAGQGAAEAIFKYVSVLLYAVYAIFLVLALWSFGPAIARGLAQGGSVGAGLAGGVTYASYNVIGAVLILPVLRHLRSGRDAVVAGLIAGPLAMLPAIVFFLCLIAFYPAIMPVALPSDVMLRAIGSTTFHYTFQLMVFFALLECSVGFVQAFVARVDGHHARRGRATPPAQRILIPAAILVGAVFIATAIGLVALIASGYRLMAYATVAVFIIPLLTVGLTQLVRGNVGRATATGVRGQMHRP